jgi:hypothetical protein
MRIRGLAEGQAHTAFGGGIAISLLAPRPLRPGADLSIMHHRLPRTSYGDVCPFGAGADLITGTGTGYDLAAGLCSAPGDEGEFAANLGSTGASLRLRAGVAPWSATLSAAVQRDASDVSFGLRASPVLPLLGRRDVYVRGSNLRLEQTRVSSALGVDFRTGRWSATAAAGWTARGGVAGGVDDLDIRYDARRPTFHGSIGLGLTL